MTQMTAFPPDGVAPGLRSGVSEGSGTREPAQDPIRRLARVLDPVAYDPRAEPRNVGQHWDRKSRQMVAEVHATAAHSAGYRRLVEDDDTIERAAKALYAKKQAQWKGVAELPAGDLDDHWEFILTDSSRDEYRQQARAVVRALREET